MEGYTPKQRERIIDEVFRLFKEIFGEYPKVAGSWILDSHSMNYMCEKYGIKAFCNCRDQWATDAYTLWGGYYSGGYYPSKYNMICPAQNADNQIPAPLFRMLGIDPIYGYDERKYNPHFTDQSGCWTMEPAWPSGKSPEIMDWYFKEYYTNPCLSHSQATTGQENSFGMDMLEGYAMQIEKLAKLRDEGVVALEKLGETGEKYKRAFETTPPAALMALSDWAGNNLKTVWFNSKYYRTNVLLKDNRLFFRDINKFDELYKERYLDKPCVDWDARYDNLPVVDSRIWSKDGKEAGLFLDKDAESISVEEEGNRLKIFISFKDGSNGVITFDEASIAFENCGTLDYRIGILEDITNVKFAENTLDFVHNDYCYSVAVCGTMEKTGEGAKISSKDGKIVFDLFI